MFTGIISHLGIFKKYGVGKQEMALEAPAQLVTEIEVGDSIAVDGVCLSLIKKEERTMKENIINVGFQIIHNGVTRSFNINLAIVHAIPNIIK